MPRISFGPTVRDRAECLLRHFLRTFHTQLHKDPQLLSTPYPHFYPSQSERHNKLEVKTTLDALNHWLHQDATSRRWREPVSKKCRALIRPGKIGCAELQEALNRLQDIGILKRHPLTTRPATWHFTLILPRTPLTTESHAHFYHQWQHHRPASQVSASGDLSHPPPTSTRLLGRTSDLVTLTTRYHQGDRLILVYGSPGHGKTALARHLLASLSPTYQLEMVFSQDPSLPFPLQDWLTAHLLPFNPQPHPNWILLLDQWQHALKTQTISILVDGFEKALTPTGGIHNPRWLDWLKVLSHPHNQALSLLTSHQVIQNPAVTTKIYHLSGLSLNDWHTYFTQGGIHPPANLEALHTRHQGSPKAMRQLANSLSQHDTHKGEKKIKKI